MAFSQLCCKRNDNVALLYLVRKFRPVSLLATFQPYGNRLSYCLYLCLVRIPTTDLDTVEVSVSHHFFLTLEAPVVLHYLKAPTAVKLTAVGFIAF